MFQFDRASGKCRSEEQGAISMNDGTTITTEFDEDEADADIGCEVSDEALEAAAGTYTKGQSIMTVGMTIVMGGCC
jgi:hypothetical protein